MQVPNDQLIRAFWDEKTGLNVEIYYKFLNGVTSKDIAPGQLLGIGDKQFPIIDWSTSKESGNPIFTLKGYIPAVERINRLIN